MCAAHYRKASRFPFLNFLLPHLRLSPYVSSSPTNTHPSNHLFPLPIDPYTPPAVAQSVHRASLPDQDAADLTGTGDNVRVVTQHKKKNSGPTITNYVEISLPTKEGMCFFVCVCTGSID